jgi:16S rRNA (guanine1516-N2)-methyltransferase
MQHQADICIISTETDNGQIKSLSSGLSLPVCENGDNPFRYHLVYTENRLELHHNPHLTNFKELPIKVDFLKNTRVHPRLLSTTIKDPLPKAVGVKPGVRPHIIDGTAGLGMDAMQLAWIGCHVTLIERSPVIHALLKDGLQRARQNRELCKVIDKNIQLFTGDSTEIIATLSSSPHTILLDPMYPSGSKHARNRKEMRILRDIVGDDEDIERLFEAALQFASNRVVVKRPKLAPLISRKPLPSHQITMKSGRFDVYLMDHL